MSDAGRLVLRGGGITAIGFLVRFGARFLFLFVAARWFGAGLLGAYALALAMVEVGVLAGGLGSRWLVFHWLDTRGERAARHVVTDAAVITGIASTVTAVVVASVVLALPAGTIAGDTRIALLLMAPVIVVQTLVELLLAATRWTHALRWEITAKNLIQPYSGVAVAIGGALAGWQAIGLPLAYAVSSLAALGYAWWGLQRTIPPAADYRLEFARLRALLGSTPSNAGADLVDAAVGRVDLYLVGVLLGESAAGAYAMAKQLAVLLRQVRQSFDGLLVPLVARTLARDGVAAAVAATASATRLVLAVQLPVVLAFAAVGGTLLGWFGAGFVAAWPALVALALAESVQSAFGIGDLLFVYRRPGLVLAMSMVALALVTLACWAAIPAWGLTGAGMAVLVGALARGILRRWSVGRLAGRAAPMMTLVPIVVAVVVALVMGWASRSSPVVVLVAMLAGYGATLWLALRATGTTLAPISLASGRSAAPAPDSSSRSATG